MNTKRMDFEKQWHRRGMTLQESQGTAPDDEIILAMAKRAQEETVSESRISLRPARNITWLPYAAACLLIGATAITLSRYRGTPQIPVAEKVVVEGQTVRFLCNSGCSAYDVFHSAQQVLSK